VIALAVLFGTVIAGLCVVGSLTSRVRHEAAVLSEKVSRATDGRQVSSADLRERIQREGSRR
jgi:hypothetical protein